MQQLEIYKDYAIIYMFTSPSGKSYIGQSINFKNRYNKYKRNSINSIGKYFSSAILKYNGIENFKLTILFKFKIFESIEETKKYLDKLEIFYIKKFNTFKNGYNLLAGGKGSFKRVITEETRKKLSEANKGKGLGNRVERIKVKCETCKITFEKTLSQIRKNKTNKHYCSSICGYKSLETPLKREKVLFALVKFNYMKQVKNYLHTSKDKILEFCKKENIVLNQYLKNI